MRPTHRLTSGASAARVAVVVPVALLALLAAGCGAGDDDGEDAVPGGGEESTSMEQETLEGRTFTSTAVSGHELASQDPIRLAFEEGRLSASAGCNTMFGPYALEGDELAWTAEPATTLMACGDVLEQQDRWLAELLTAGVTAASEGRRLTLTSGDVTIELADTSSPDLASLLGRTWTAVATISGDATASLPAEVTSPRLGVRPSGQARLSTGCNTGRTVVRVEGDTLTFGPTTTTRVACRPPARAVERTVLRVLDGTADQVTFEGSVLVVVRGEDGLVFEVR
jgi:heat shock protein HslJ